MIGITKVGVQGHEGLSNVGRKFSSLEKWEFDAEGNPGSGKRREKRLSLTPITKGNLGLWQAFYRAMRLFTYKTSQIEGANRTPIVTYSKRRLVAIQSATRGSDQSQKPDKLRQRKNTQKWA